MAAFSSEEGGYHARRPRLRQFERRGPCGRGWWRSRREAEPEGNAAVQQEWEKRERGSFGTEAEGGSEIGMGSLGAHQRRIEDLREANHRTAEQTGHRVRPQETQAGGQKETKDGIGRIAG